MATRREQLYPEIKRLREVEGLMWREIGERLGLAKTTVQDYYSDPDNSKHMERHRRWQKNDFATCPVCGGQMTGNALRRNPAATCAACERKARAERRAERLQLVARMYNDGATTREIADALGYATRSTPPEVTQARRLGLIGYRNRGYGEAA